jgi:hypothetical protein
MPLRLNDEHCLLWIKDPSISPFENKNKKRKDILSADTLKNPKSFLNKIKRKCFYNSVLRNKIVEQIKEYQRLGTLRLYTLNDKLSDTIEYITPPFTIEDCEKWAKNHLVNPKTDVEITLVGKVYIELMYTAIQYGLPLPSFIDTVPTDAYYKTLHKVANKIVKNVLYRLEFMKQNDEYFLNHDVESFDRKLTVALPTTPGHRAARVAAAAAAKPNNSFGISASTASYISLNSAERRQLRDIALENKEERNLVAEYQYKKQLLPKEDKEVDKTLFSTLRELIKSIIFYSKNLIKNILKDATVGARARLTVPVHSYINKVGRRASYVKSIVDNNNLDTAEGIIEHFISNMFSQLIDPSFLIPIDIDITCFSFNNKKSYFRNAELINKIVNELFNFIDEYIELNNLLSSNKIPTYLRNIVVDVIPKEFVAKRERDGRYITGTSILNSNYQNCYYKMLLEVSEEPKKLTLPEGRGLLIGKELTYAIEALDEPYFITYPEDRVVTDDNPLNGFTYEECKDWVIMPIINPRTFKPILIDSPIYNRLLCISYQYDTELIPRMITSRGYKIILALTAVIEDILKNEGKIPQSRDQLEQFIIDKERQFAKEKEMKDLIPNNVIGSKWKYVGVKQPKAGVEIINKKLTEAFEKSKGTNTIIPFYVFFSEKDLEKFGITDITKNSYVNIATYYVPVDDKSSRRRSRTAAAAAAAAAADKIGLKWKKVGMQSIEGEEIINKKLTDVFLKSKSSDGKLPLNILFTEEDLAKFGITTIPKKSYIKVPNYYTPVVEKKAIASYVKPKSNSNLEIKKRDKEFVVKNYYTVTDCLRWANQPNRDPKNPNILFHTDSEEYNIIFEQAILYDYNITPINITRKGIKFRQAILKNTEKYLTIAKHLKHSKSKGLDIAEINTKICNAIKNIFDDETKEEGKNYKKFKNIMIEKCEQYNKPPSICIEELKVSINAYFQHDDVPNGKYEIKYYQDSALASILIEYDTVKNAIYKEEFKDIFIQNINAFYVYIYEIDDELNETMKDAIDAGGPKREFFTKLFEELFCDDEHLTRPFICPKDIIGYKYYINPNFEPDENFRRVIDARKKNYSSIHTTITEYKTEKEYEYIYFVIGKILGITFYNEDIGLPQQFSEYILARFINQQNDMDYYDILYFYLKEFNNANSYMNMINNTNIETLENSDLSFNDTYIINKSKDPSSVNKDVEPPIPIKAQLPIDLLRYKMLSTTKDAIKNSSNERKLREYDEKWKKQLNEYVMKKKIYDRAGNKTSGTSQITKQNFIKFLLQQSKHAVTKNFITINDDKVKSAKNMKKRYDSLFAGFSNEIRKFLYRKKVTINQLNLLITNDPLTYAILNELVNKIVLKIEVSTLSESDPDYDPEAKLTEQQKSEKEREMKGYISNIITRRRDGDSEKEHFEFVKNLLRFWTTLSYFNKTGHYRIFYKYGVGINVQNLPKAQTCFNQLIIFGFPVDTPDKIYTPEMKEEFIYKKLLLAVGEQQMEMQ